jgi:hypothetical protein
MINNSISEGTVSRATAELLKSLGFDCWVNTWYQKGNGIVGAVKGGEYKQYNSMGQNYVSQPIFQQAMDWLYENFGLFIQIAIQKSDNGFEFAYIVKSSSKENSLKRVVKEPGFTSSKEAKEAAIRYCVYNLVKDKEEKEARNQALGDAIRELIEKMEPLDEDMAKVMDDMLKAKIGNKPTRDREW